MAGAREAETETAERSHAPGRSCDGAAQGVGGTSPLALAHGARPTPNGRLRPRPRATVHADSLARPEIPPAPLRSAASGALPAAAPRPPPQEPRSPRRDVRHLRHEPPRLHLVVGLPRRRSERLGLAEAAADQGEAVGPGQCRAGAQLPCVPRTPIERRLHLAEVVAELARRLVRRRVRDGPIAGVPAVVAEGREVARPSP
eukprot:CAMPEP_0176241000 /NCGR_PEP_ID=MMETSP0121_2-20121125/29664_1 /TAXON_ID=160619 /ORGANISM="Kryptoperidinium foliaceum, Strain CCMP 1326" /LENGTH=200 /DNA_ID=CAMNT_0017580511 /DNA_START=68 /DNA_END=667 /DNA_ORIENTATION=-